jgi:hypothetical protein
VAAGNDGGLGMGGGFLVQQESDRNYPVEGPELLARFEKCVAREI